MSVKVGTCNFYLDSECYTVGKNTILLFLRLRSIFPNCCTANKCVNPLQWLYCTDIWSISHSNSFSTNDWQAHVLRLISFLLLSFCWLGCCSVLQLTNTFFKLSHWQRRNWTKTLGVPVTPNVLSFVNRLTESFVSVCYPWQAASTLRISLPVSSSPSKSSSLTYPS